jgi:hypothetical protein
MIDCVQAHVAAMMQEQRRQADTWREQNEQDQRADMQQLEGLMLQAVGGVEGLNRQLTTQEGMLEGQAVTLEQVQRWLAEMHASSSIITGHLQRLHANQGGEHIEVSEGGINDCMAAVLRRCPDHVQLKQQCCSAGGVV